MTFSFISKLGATSKKKALTGATLPSRIPSSKPYSKMIGPHIEVNSAVSSVLLVCGVAVNPIKYLQFTNFVIIVLDDLALLWCASSIIVKDTYLRASFGFFKVLRDWMVATTISPSNLLTPSPNCDTLKP